MLSGRARRTSWFSRFAALAKANRVWLTGSLLEVQADGTYYNCMPLYDPVGALAAAYRKVHLFRLMDEDRYPAPGQDTTLLDLPWGRAGSGDLLRSALSGTVSPLCRERGAAHPHPGRVALRTRQEHWRTFLRARAIENQCFVAGCNRVGDEQWYAISADGSAVIDPWGETLVEGGEEEELLTVTIDLAECAAARASNSRLR